MRKLVITLTFALLAAGTIAVAQGPSATGTTAVILDAVKAEDAANRGEGNTSGAREAAVAAKLFGVFDTVGTTVKGGFVTFQPTSTGLANYTVGRAQLFSSVALSGTVKATTGLTTTVLAGDVVALAPDTPLGVLIFLGGDLGGDVTFTPTRKMEVGPAGITVTSGDAKGAFVPANPTFRYRSEGSVVISVPAEGRLVFWVANADSPAKDAFRSGLESGSAYGGVVFATMSDGNRLTQTIPLGAAAVVDALDASGARLTIKNPGTTTRVVDIFLTPEVFGISALTELNVTRDGTRVPYAKDVKSLYAVNGTASAFANVGTDLLQVSVVAPPGSTVYGLEASKATPVVKAGEWIAFNQTGPVVKQEKVYTDPGWWTMVAMFGSIALLGAAIAYVRRYGARRNTFAARAGAGKAGHSLACGLARPRCGSHDRGATCPPETPRPPGGAHPGLERPSGRDSCPP